MLVAQIRAHSQIHAPQLNEREWNKQFYFFNILCFTVYIKNNIIILDYYI